MTIPTPPTSKEELRQRMHALPAPTTAEIQAIHDQIDAWLASLESPITIATYAALRDEIDLRPLLTRHPRHRWVFPRVNGDALDFFIITDPATQLKPAAFGIAEPDGTTPTVACTDINAFLCPGLAFDTQGGRLGRGRGFYDRALAHADRGSLKIGICRPSQRVAHTFSETHDIRMNLIIDGTQSTTGT